MFDIKMWVRLVAMSLVLASTSAAVHDVLLDVSAVPDASRSSLDTIWSLIAIPQSNTTKWWATFDQCEYRSNSTIVASIAGFSSDRGDLLQVLRYVEEIKPDHALVQFIPTLETNGTRNDTEQAGDVGLEHFCLFVAAHGDVVWRQAVWRGLQHAFVDPALDWAEVHGLVSDLARAILMDIAVDQGIDAMTETLRFMPRDVKTPNEDGDEAEYLHAYLQAYKQVTNKASSSERGGKSGSGHVNASARVLMWESILATRNLDLTGKIEVKYGDIAYAIHGQGDRRRRLLTIRAKVEGWGEAQALSNVRHDGADADDRWP